MMSDKEGYMKYLAIILMIFVTGCVTYEPSYNDALYISDSNCDWYDVDNIKGILFGFTIIVHVYWTLVEFNYWEVWLVGRATRFSKPSLACLAAAILNDRRLVSHLTIIVAEGFATSIN